MGKHSKPEPATTTIPEARLVELRQAGIADERDNGPFIDPHILQKSTAVLDRRGESWAASVLGRDISRRSRAVPRRSYLHDGESRTLIAADHEEDRVAASHIDPDLTNL
ncbi:hypothetical protein ACNQVK_00740 [Mycobacterium sp. 134]|uniref:hypothetical protein n=1 Tax=Mycobacterium sp. 134 TaxID=3400425 RepID=UPI003AAEB223